MMFRRDRRSAFADFQQVQLPEMHQLQRSDGAEVQQKTWCRVLPGAGHRNYAEVYQVKSCIKKEVQNNGRFKFRGVLSTFLQQIERCTSCGVKQDMIILKLHIFARAECVRTRLQVIAIAHFYFV